MDGLKPYILMGTALGVLESLLIPPFLPFRLGLANAATLAAVLLLGTRAGLYTTVVRTLAVSAITGGLLSLPMFFSLAGGIVSAITMSAVALLPVSILAVSASGGAASMVAQLALFAITGSLSIDTSLVLLPWMSSWGILSGLAVGLIATRLPCPRAEYPAVSGSLRIDPQVRIQ
ncbi:MAG: Gx transporter family protein [Candidatus Hydrogenedentota bacterium]